MERFEEMEYTQEEIEECAGVIALGAFTRTTWEQIINETEENFGSDHPETLILKRAYELTNNAY